jgi:hypothetical protein
MEEPESREDGLVRDVPAEAREAHRCLRDRVHAHGRRVPTSEQGSTRRRAQGSCVELRIADTLINDPLHVRHLYAPAIEVPCPDTGVIPQEHHNVRGTLWRLRLREGTPILFRIADVYLNSAFEFSSRYEPSSGADCCLFRDLIMSRMRAMSRSAGLAHTVRATRNIHRQRVRSCSPGPQK